MDASNLSAAFLDRMRQVGDQEADVMIAEVFATESVEAVNAMLRHFDENQELVPSAVPPLVQDFIKFNSALPHWADRRLLALGDDLFGRYAPQIVAALFCASLPMCYAAGKGVQVLARTQRLSRYTYRRIMETAQFLMDVMADDGFEPHGRAVRSSQKVRILHATIRHHLRHDPSWDPALGVPINQEDLAGTLTSFSACIIRALGRLGIDLTDEESLAYVHIWSVVGHLLGIDARLLPHSYEEAAALMDLITARQWEASEAGREMTRALIDHMKYTLPGNLLDGFPVVLMRHLCGDRAADLLGVEPGDWTTALLKPLRALTALSDGIQDRSALIARLTAVVGRKLLESMMYVDRGGERYEVRIPRSAQEKWGIMT